MTRPIRLKAWDHSKKEWLPTYDFGNGHQGIEVWDHKNGKIPKHIEIVQFTGLTDRHEVDIYEGDILSGDSRSVPWYKVVWEDYGWKLRGLIHHDNGKKSGIVFSIGDAKLSQIEVIGNIHETPELLEAK